MTIGNKYSNRTWWENFVAIKKDSYEELMTEIETQMSLLYGGDPDKCEISIYLNNFFTDFPLDIEGALNKSIMLVYHVDITDEDFKIKNKDISRSIHILKCLMKEIEIAFCSTHILAKLMTSIPISKN